MKKRMLCTFLALVMMFGMAPSAFAAVGLDNFAEKRDYNDVFMDVSSDDWYYVYVADMYRYGLVEGREADVFAPDESMTRAEVITLSCRIHNIYMGGSAVFQTGADPWYSPYVEYALEKGIIKKTDFTDGYDKAATRAEIAYILGSCVPQSELPAINDIGRIPDINGGGLATQYFSYPQIYCLYAAGVLTGMDEYGSFQGSSTVKRSEVMTLACRIIDEELRKEFELEELNSVREILIAGRWRNYGVTVGTAGILRFFEDGTCVTDYIHSRVYGTYTLEDGVLNIKGYGISNMAYDMESGVFGKDSHVVIQTMQMVVDALSPMTIDSYEKHLALYVENQGN